MSCGIGAFEVTRKITREIVAVMPHYKRDASDFQVNRIHFLRNSRHGSVGVMRHRDVFNK